MHSSYNSDTNTLINALMHLTAINQLIVKHKITTADNYETLLAYSESFVTLAVLICSV